MKRLTSFIYASALLLGLSVSTTAQNAYEWDFHGIGFEVAADFEVSVNSESEFSAVSSDGVLSITLMPWADDQITMDNLAEATVDYALELAVFDRAEVDGDGIDLGDLEGYFIVAATDDYYTYDFLLLALLLDTESPTNLAVAIGFMDGNEEEAIEMLTSIYVYDP